MDTPQVAHKHENVTISMVALSWLGLVLMLWGIVCAFRFYICGAVLAAIGAISYIKATREIQVPTTMKHQTENQPEMG